MKDDEIALSFYKSFIRTRLRIPSVDGGSYEFYIIEMPDDENDVHEIKRSFTVPVSKLKNDKRDKNIKFTYLKKDREYRVMRSLYDENSRSTRVEETGLMTGQQIADVFRMFRNRQREKFEEKFIPHDEGKEEG